MAQKTKRDWLEEGLRVLDQRGAEALTIDELATRLGVTKGSFYHHFKNYGVFKESLLAFFEEEGTLQIIALTEKASTAQAKLDILLEVTSTGSHSLDVAMRAWAIQDEQVYRYQERIDKRRIAYLQDLFKALHYDEWQALRQAHLFYSLYVGSQHVLPPLPGKDLASIYEDLKRLFPSPL